MPRIARINISSALYHVICRLVDGRFEFDTLLRSDYLCRFGKVTRNSDWKVIAYALTRKSHHIRGVSRGNRHHTVFASLTNTPSIRSVAE